MPSLPVLPDTPLQFTDICPDVSSFHNCTIRHLNIKFVPLVSGPLDVDDCLACEEVVRNVKHLDRSK